MNQGEDIVVFRDSDFVEDKDNPMIKGIIKLSDNESQYVVVDKKETLKQEEIYYIPVETEDGKIKHYHPAYLRKV